MTQPNKLAMLHDRREEAALLSGCIKDLHRPLHILEAGCGRKWPLDLTGVRYRLTGLDLDPAALESRVREVGDLHEAIVGDVCAPDAISPETYDVVYSSFVLEHIKDAERALENMVRGVKTGGLLVLRIPDRDGVYGWTARRTPFSLHVAYYRFVQGRKNAGRPGHAPYPTYHMPIVSRSGIRAFSEKHGCEILHELGHGYYLRGRGRRAFAAATKAYAVTVSALSWGSLAWRHNDLTYVLRKN